MKPYATYLQSKRWPIKICFGDEDRLLTIEQAKELCDTLTEILDNLLCQPEYKQKIE